MRFHRKTIFVALSAASFMAGAASTDKKTDNETKPGELPTITVTAEKVAKGEQQTPISMYTLTDFDIERRKIDNIYDVSTYIPNFYMTKAGNTSDAGFFTIRGLTPGMEGEQAVGFFVDGVYSALFDAELLDVDRVEVLRGPQATLYGRNTEAGVLNVITKDPDTVPEYKVGLSYGSYNRTQADALAGGAIGDSEDWSYRTALKYVYGDGYFKRESDGAKDVDRIRDFYGRVKLRWQPMDGNWDVISIFESQNKRDGNSPFVNWNDIKSGRKYVKSDYGGQADVDVWKAQMKAVYSWDTIDFTSISAYNHDKKIDNEDLDFTNVDEAKLLMDRETRYFSQEFRLNSTDQGPFNWLLGTYFLHQDDNNTIAYRYNSYDYFQSGNTQIKTDNYAVFGNAGYYVLDNVELVAGVRYDYDKKRLHYTSTGTMMGYPTGDGEDNNDRSFDAWLPKAGVNWYVTPEAMLYASISKGYKSGGFNTLGPNMARSYDAEHTTNYEVGLKSDWFDHSVRWNTSLFWIDMKNQQTEVTFYPDSYTANSGKSVSRGVETDLTWQATDALRLAANAGYTDAKFKDFPTEVDNGTGTYVSTNYKDKRPANAPAYNYGFSADYNFANGFFVRTDYNVTGSIYFDNANTKKQSAYGLLNLFAGYTTNEYDITAYVKNVTNETYVTRAFNMNGDWYARAGEPVNFGVSVNYKF
ncbi:TonB-dependent receptor [Erwinia sp. INIA-01]|uniref:TonB-dependent receptor n=1 Tax=Erwinia sp. INIA01 TaxID=2991500 RepID=UPI002224FAF1|nr:TonB-dependent receptor [Erwinia sp. INIA01]MCW1875093.1 TonB-dependent receptor [Erwinia sp. INIA01]